MKEENFKILEAFMAGGNHIDVIRKVYNFSTLFLKRMDYVRDKAAKEDGDTDVNFKNSYNKYISDVKQFVSVYKINERGLKGIFRVFKNMDYQDFMDVNHGCMDLIYFKDGTLSRDIVEENFKQRKNFNRDCMNIYAKIARFVK